MKKIKHKLFGIFLLLSACTLCSCVFVGFKASELSSLEEFSKSYVGVYECKYMSLGEKDLLADYKYIRMELKDNDKYLLTYADKRGRENKREGDYSYDKKNDLITVREKMLSRFNANTFAVKDGIICVSQPYGRRIFIARFEML